MPSDVRRRTRSIVMQSTSLRPCPTNQIIAVTAHRPSLQPINSMVIHIAAMRKSPTLQREFSETRHLEDACLSNVSWVHLQMIMRTNVQGFLAWSRSLQCPPHAAGIPVSRLLDPFHNFLGLYHTVLLQQLGKPRYTCKLCWVRIRPNRRISSGFSWQLLLTHHTHPKTRPKTSRHN